MFIRFNLHKNILYKELYPISDWKYNLKQKKMVAKYIYYRIWKKNTAKFYKRIHLHHIFCDINYAKYWQQKNTYFFLLSWPLRKITRSVRHKKMHTFIRSFSPLLCSVRYVQKEKEKYRLQTLITLEEQNQ